MERLCFVMSIFNEVYSVKLSIKMKISLCLYYFPIRFVDVHLKPIIKTNIENNDAYFSYSSSLFSYTKANFIK